VCEALFTVSNAIPGAFTTCFNIFKGWKLVWFREVEDVRSADFGRIRGDEKLQVVILKKGKHLVEHEVENVRQSAEFTLI